ncbi:unnamed protein product [Schistosoma margrebowiei]|uniref:Uncharacterized protein n=1 Tax=Schistosoma margrebowiei TaxID=48269 RepID=A0A183LGX0_9TREM|nr:unnamed protein product [Schistosoma margrebowiei]
MTITHNLRRTTIEYTSRIAGYTGRFKVNSHSSLYICSSSKFPKCKLSKELNNTIRVITNIEEQRNRWVEHFKELLNLPAPLNPPNIEAAPTDLPINVGPPTIEEISMAIKQIKSGKAAGTDNIPAEALKADLDGIIDEHGGSDADVRARIVRVRTTYLQQKNTWNSKHLSVNQHQGQNFQCKCQDTSTVWHGNLENDESHHPQDTGVY